MKFELEPYHRNISPADIRDDIRRVADQLKKTAITTAEYRQHGRYSPRVAQRRFGSWSKALAEASLGETRILAVPVEECLSDLKDVAKRLRKNAVTVDEYVENGRYSAAPFVRHFGSWFKALAAAGLERTRTLHVTNEEYFENLEEMWVALGRQPHYSDVQKPFSKFSAGAYENRFGSWRKALQAFIDFVNEGRPDSHSTGNGAPEPNGASLPTPTQVNDALPKRAPRTISWRLRFLVMRRDNFKCRICGRSPATTPGLNLHIDHVEPWSKGGPTAMENLQTLCEQDNIGKSNLSMEAEEEG